MELFSAALADLVVSNGVQAFDRELLRRGRTAFKGGSSLAYHLMRAVAVQLATNLLTDNVALNSDEE